MKGIIALILTLAQLLGGMGLSPELPASAGDSGSILVFEPDTGEPVTDGELSAARDVLESRLSVEGIDCDIEVTADNRLRVRTFGAADIGKIAETASKRGELELCYQYSEPDEYGNTRYAPAMAGNKENISGVNVCYNSVVPGGRSEYYVQICFTPQGRAAFTEATRNAVNRSFNGEAIIGCIAIVLDGDVISVSAVDTVIDTDTCIIHGNFDKESARALAGIIGGGALPFGLRLDGDRRDGEAIEP